MVKTIYRKQYSSSYLILLSSSSKYDTVTMCKMADLQSPNTRSWRWNIASIISPCTQGNFFLSSSFGAYLDVGDIVVLKSKISVTGTLQSRIAIFATSLLSNLHHNMMTDSLQERWIQMNWWVELEQSLHTPATNYTSLPTNII